MNDIQKIHFSDLHEYHEFLGLPKPEHPLFSISTINTDTTGNTNTSCGDESATTFRLADGLEITADFYTISLKHIIEGAIHYGRTQYDFKNGSLICMAPRQPVRIEGVKTKSNATVILIHEDFLRGTSIRYCPKKCVWLSLFLPVVSIET